MPLSEYEQRQFEQIERELSKDPKFGRIRMVNPFLVGLLNQFRTMLGGLSEMGTTLRSPKQWSDRQLRAATVIFFALTVTTAGFLVGFLGFSWTVKSPNFKWLAVLSVQSAATCAAFGLFAWCEFKLARPRREPARGRKFPGWVVAIFMGLLTATVIFAVMWMLLRHGGPGYKG